MVFWPGCSVAMVLSVVDVSAAHTDNFSPLFSPRSHCTGWMVTARALSGHEVVTSESRRPTR